MMSIGPRKEISGTDPSKIVHGALTYFKNNRQRINDPKYRREGMPATSSLIESLSQAYQLAGQRDPEILESA